MPKDSMRVCLYSGPYPPHYGGSRIQAHTLAAGLVRHGVPVEALAVCTHGLPRTDTMDGVLVRRRWPPNSFPGFIKRPIWGRQACSVLRRRADEFDVFHVIGPCEDGATGMACARELGIGTLVKLTNLYGDDPLSLKGDPAARCFDHADAIVCTSPALRQACLEAGYPPEQVPHIPNGVDMQRFSPCEDKRRIREQLGLPVDAFIGLTIGHLSAARKRMDFIVRVWAKAFGGDENAYLALVGPMRTTSRTKAAQIQKVKEAIRETGLEDRVILTGGVPDPEHYLQAADVFTFASVMEGQPNAVLEAMSAGVPCVVSRLPGITDDLIEPGSSGWLVEEDDIDGFAASLAEVRGDPAAAEARGRAAVEKISRSAGIDVVVDQYIDLYRRITGR